MNTTSDNIEKTREILERVGKKDTKEKKEGTPDDDGFHKRVKSDPAEPKSPEELSSRYAEDIAALRKVREDLKRMREGSK